MLKIYNQPRKTGKTGAVKLALYEDSKAIALVPNHSGKGLFPDSLRPRVYTFEQFLKGDLKDEIFSQIFIDEGLLIDSASIASFYYTLGYNHCDVTVYATSSEMEKQNNEQ